MSRSHDIWGFTPRKPSFHIFEGHLHCLLRFFGWWRASPSCLAWGRVKQAIFFWWFFLSLVSRKSASEWQNTWDRNGIKAFSPGCGKWLKLCTGNRRLVSTVLGPTLHCLPWLFLADFLRFFLQIRQKNQLWGSASSGTSCTPCPSVSQTELLDHPMLDHCTNNYCSTRWWFHILFWKITPNPWRDESNMTHMTHTFELGN